MATTVLMPKLGNTVESSMIVAWRKAIGDQVAEGDVLCEVETDKATVEVESTASGTLLALFFSPGDDVTVLAPIAAIGKPGEDISGLSPHWAGAESSREPDGGTDPIAAEPAVIPITTPLTAPSFETPVVGVSPRAKNLAKKKGLPLAGIQGTGPGGRVIGRDVLVALAARPSLTPVAKKMIDQGEYSAPAHGSAAGGRITKNDLIPVGAPAGPAASSVAEEVEIVPVKGIRKIVAERMLNSLQTTAQLTLNASTDARMLLGYRQRLKDSTEALGLQKVTINDLILFAVSRLLQQYPDLNALFAGETISRYRNVHLGFAVDTPRGLMVPIIRNANTLGLKQISLEAKRLATACFEGRIAPDELSGGTFTVSNLGAFGIESFTPVLNPPQVGILGVGNVNLKPMEIEGEVCFIPHIGLSLTINHQVVDGVPGARFLQAASQALADIDLLLAL